METFDHTKKMMLEKLYKPDKSWKGDVDTKAIPIIELINAQKDFYTTSSCSGRISVFFVANSGRKDLSDWLFVKHRTIEFKELAKPLERLPLETVWFRQEPPIFHVACRTMDAAKKILEICNGVGLKHSGIIGHASKRFIVQIVFSNKMEVPIAESGELFVEDRFLKFLVKQANAKFKKNQKLLLKLEKKLKSDL